MVRNGEPYRTGHEVVGHYRHPILLYQLVRREQWPTSLRYLLIRVVLDSPIEGPERREAPPTARYNWASVFSKDIPSRQSLFKRPVRKLVNTSLLHTR
jgi:hypothetical protein